jgi:hypothetical protein
VVLDRAGEGVGGEEEDGEDEKLRCDYYRCKQVGASAIVYGQ